MRRSVKMTQNMIAIQLKKLLNIFIYKQMDKLTCQLCKNSLHEPNLCPHCSQVFCKQCIRKYLAQKHFCPTCDNYIIDLVDCGRLVNELEQVLLMKKNSSIKNEIENKFCQSHGLELSYFCKNCKNWICSDCGVIEDKHRGHEIVTKSQAFSCNKQKISQSYSKLKLKLEKLIEKKQRCSIDLEVYKTELKWSKQKIKKYCNELLIKIDRQGQKQIEQLQQKVKQHQHMIDQMRFRLRDIDKVLNPGNGFNIPAFKKILHSQLKSQKMTENQNGRYKGMTKRAIHSQKQVQGKGLIKSQSQLSIQLQQQQTLFLSNPRKIQTIQQIFPTFTSFTYEFDYQNLKQDNFHYSDYFQLWGQDWRLKIYPNGNKTTNIAGKYLSIFLQLATGHAIDKPKKYVYRIELLSLNKAGSTIVKEFCSAFDSGQSWGYSDYLPLNSLNEYLHEGKLLFSLSIRNQTYEGLSNDLKKYITKIQNENKILEKLLCESSYSNPSSSKQKQYSGLYSQSQQNLSQHINEYSLRSSDLHINLEQSSQISVSIGSS